MRLANIVDRDVVSVTLDTLVSEAARLLIQYRLEMAPVVEHGQVLGQVSLRTLEAATRHAPLTHIRNLVLDKCCALPPETELSEALTFARHRGAAYVVVSEQGRLIGMVPTVRIAAMHDA